MAAYDELRTLFNDDSLRNRITTAVVIAAHAQVIADPGTANGRAWGLKVLQSPEVWGNTTAKAVLAAAKALTVVNITGAIDSGIQAYVDAVVPGMIAAEAGV